MEPKQIFGKTSTNEEVAEVNLEESEAIKQTSTEDISIDESSSKEIVTNQNTLNDQNSTKENSS